MTTPTHPQPDAVEKAIQTLKEQRHVSHDELHRHVTNFDNTESKLMESYATDLAASHNQPDEQIERAVEKQLDNVRWLLNGLTVIGDFDPATKDEIRKCIRAAVRQAVEAEREACAKLAEEYADANRDGRKMPSKHAAARAEHSGRLIADRIRARTTPSTEGDNGTQ